MAQVKRQPKRQPMTAEQAKTFGRFSITNAAMAVGELTRTSACSGKCDPYQDIFTYNRWRAQGFQVQRGQHGAKLPVIVNTGPANDSDHDDDVDSRKPGRRLMWTTTVFCRCQVQPVRVNDVPSN